MRLRGGQLFPNRVPARIPVETLEQLYRRHAQAVFRFAYKLAGNRATAEDLAHDAFVALARNCEKIDQTQLPSWLLRVVRNAVIDRWRHQDIEREHLDALLRPPTGPPTLVERWVLDCKDLRPSHRRCLMLQFFNGMSVKEIADATGLTENQVKRALQTGMKLLRKTHGSPAAS